MVTLLMNVASATAITLFVFGLLSRATRSWIKGRIPRDGKIIAVDGLDLHYVDRGVGRPIVLIHGLSGQLRNFAPALVNRLAADHRVILIDRPGSGYSAPFPAGKNTLAGQADKVASLIAELGLNAPLIVGHSLGGAVALNLALNHPGEVGGLALIAPATQPIDKPALAFRAMAIPSDVLRRLVSLTFAAPLGLLIFDRFARAVFAPEPMPTQFATKGGGLLVIRPDSYFAAGGDMIAVREALPVLAARYPSLRMPVDVLFGRSDQVLEPDIHGVRLRDAVPGATLTQIEGGHMIVYTRPEIVADWILAQDTKNVQIGRLND